MKKIKFAFILLLIINCTEVDPVADEELYACNTSISNTHPSSSKFQSFLNEKTNQGLPGITMSIETPKGIWFGSAGLANIPNKITMQPCSIHKIGSITKLFTATLILQLFEEGKLALSDPIVNYLPEKISSNIQNARTATVEQLLNHTSGIADYLSELDYTIDDYYNNPTKVWTAEEEIAYIFGESASFKPGEKVEYSNSNYLLLGIIAENITALTGEQLYEEYIFSKLNLNNTYFYKNGKNPSNLVSGYFDEFGNGKLIDITSLKRFSNSMVGGISSNTQDLNTFITALFTPNILLKQETITKMLTISNAPFLYPEKYIYGTNNNVKNVEGIGLGIFKLNTVYGTAYGHNGGFNGRRARAWYFPEEKKSVVFMINASGTSVKNVTREIFRNEMIELLFE